MKDFFTPFHFLSAIDAWDEALLSSVENGLDREPISDIPNPKVIDQILRFAASVESRQSLMIGLIESFIN
ncbi:MAG: hypothetical protein WCR58_05075 [Bacteroidales bacterium]|jgi:hypothetical protein|nr:hypothetical protein [Bacteroidales bacterium]MCK9448495.1 hypothetical protein [Bacteroidales bacterium]MDD3701587.1 hypothetical protein [Bacteroidales bacterium]MDY0370198.1 hypothetical protein [Bacteroidales bacterium]